jgi:hypothetical protein
LPPGHPLRFEGFRTANPAYADALVPIVFSAITGVGEKLGLADFERPLTTNRVARFRCEPQPPGWDWVHCTVDLTNGCRFVYRHDRVSEYYAADDFFGHPRRPRRVPDFQGVWRLSDLEAADLARAAVGKLGYSQTLFGLERPPVIHRPKIRGTNVIPRLLMAWENRSEAGRLLSLAEFEIDADSRQLKSVHLDATNFWGGKPRIDLPVVLSPGTNAPSSRPPTITPAKSP